MFSKILLCLVVVGACVADRPRQQSSGYGRPAPQPQPSYSQPQPSYSQQPEKEEGMPFEFAYEVKDEYSGNDYSHASDSDGNVVQGEYRVLLPDGRTQIVTYTADHESGYQAEVTYEGEARPYEAPSNGGYQQQQSQNQQSYQRPEPKPQQSYQRPEPQPQQTYQRPEPQRPQQSYQRPEPQQQSYQPPQNTYQRPRPTSRPSSSYGK